MYLSKNAVFFLSPFFFGRGGKGRGGILSCVFFLFFGGGGHTEGSGVNTWSKNSKLTLISGLVSADTSADALAIIIWFKNTEYR